MDITLPAFVTEHAGFASDLSDEPQHIVAYDNPKAVEYVRQHLEEVKRPIGDALAILAFHGEDVAEAAEELKAWIDDQVDELTW